MQQEAQQQNKLYVGNLNFDATEEEVRELFSEHGVVEEVKIVMDRFSGKSRGFAFIRFQTSEEAGKAKEALNSQPFQAKTLVIDFARTEQKEPRPMGDRRDRPSGGFGAPRGDRPSGGFGAPRGDRPAGGFGGQRRERPAGGGFGAPRGDRPSGGFGGPRSDRPSGGGFGGGRRDFGGGERGNDRGGYRGGNDRGPRGGNDRGNDRGGYRGGNDHGSDPYNR